MSPVLMHHGFLWRRQDTKAEIYINGHLIESVTDDAKVAVSDATLVKTENADNSQTTSSLGNHQYRLLDLAYARSGDKGDMANIGLCFRIGCFFNPFVQELCVAIPNTTTR